MSRTVSANIVNALTSSRIINARATFRRISPSWSDQTIANYNLCSTLDDIAEGGYYIAGATDSHTDGSNGFTRVGVVSRSGGNHHVAWQTVSDTGNWPKWKINLSDADTYINGAGDLLKPSVWRDASSIYVSWYKLDNNRAYSGQISGDVLTDTSYYTLPDGDHGITAQCTAYGYFLLETDSINKITYLKFIRRSDGALISTCPGVLTNLDVNDINVKAIKVNYRGDNRLYLYISADDDSVPVSYHRRSFVVSVSPLGTNWSDIKSLTGMSWSDDITLLRYVSASIINGIPYVTADMRRPGYTYYSILMEGPDDVSFGRDMIVDYNTTSRSRMTNVGPFQVQECGDYLWALGRNRAMRSPSTNLFGNDNASMKTQTTSINDIVIANQKNSSMKLGFSVDASLIGSPGLERGGEVVIELGYNGYYAEIGKFIIDDIRQPKSAGTNSVEVIARGAAMKRLSDWTSDGYFDRWSQEKVNTDITDIFQGPTPKIGKGILIETDDSWKNNGSTFYLKDLNKRSILYNTGMSSRGGLAKATFRKSHADTRARFGMIVNYRLSNTPAGSDPDDVVYGSGIAVDYTEGDTTGTLNVYVILEGEWTLFDTVTGLDQYRTAGNYYQYVDMCVYYFSGYIHVYMRKTGNSDWGNVYKGIIDNYRLSQFPDYMSGHVAVYGENITTHTQGYPCNSNHGLYPVHDNSVFPLSNFVVRVGDEKIYVNYRTSNSRLDLNAGGVMPLYYAEGRTFKGAPHWSGTIGSGSEQQFSGTEIYFSHPNAATELSTGDVNFGYHCVLVCVDGPGKGSLSWVKGFDPEAPYQWVDTGGPYTLPETWMDHVGDLSYGYWEQDNTLIRVFVGGDEKMPRVLEGSVWNIVPGLYCYPSEDYRGYDGTIATNHDYDIVSINGDQGLYVTDFEYYSNDIDNTFVDMATMLARKAGVTDIDADARVLVIDETLNATKRYTSPDFMMNFFVVNSGFVYITVLRTNDGGGMRLTIPTGGNYVRLEYREDSGSSYYTVDYLGVMDPAIPNHGWIAVGWYNYRLAVWSNDRLVYVSGYNLINDIYPYTELDITVTSSHSIKELRWWKADMISEYFSVDMGQRGAQLLSGLVGEKNIIYGDGQYGELKIRRDRETVDGNTSSTPYNLILMSSSDDSDANSVSRIMIESLSQREYFDENYVSDVGNRFALYNAVDLTMKRDLKELADRMFLEANREYITFNGAADLRLEPNDIYYINDSGTVKEVYVDTVQFTYAVNEDGAVLDMAVSGYAKNA